MTARNDVLENKEGNNDENNSPEVPTLPILNDNGFNACGNDRI